jgi:peptide/nickel transport system ATP-binding protein
MADVATQNANVLLELKGLKMHFAMRKGFLGKVVTSIKAVDGIDFSIREGETHGLVGESGCGKTTTGRCILRAYKPTDGQILYRQENGEVVDLASLDNKGLRPYWREIRMIFQDPYSSLNPRMTLLDIVGEPLRVQKMASGSELEDRVAMLLKQVGLRPEYMRRYPHAFSGGERQRIGIARALALNPRLVVADEPVSALDVSVRAQILNLLQDLQVDLDLTYLFVAHDLSVVEYICDRVSVMYVGKMVEVAETAELYGNPKHPYTQALMSAVPRPDPRLRRRGERTVLQGEVADPADPPSGCYFHPRCCYANERCSLEEPVLHDVGGGHLVACHFAGELELAGVSAEGVVA